MSNTIKESSCGAFHNLFNAISYGTLVMLAQTPFVTSFNRVSVVSCYSNLSTIEAAKRIYQGKTDFLNRPSAKHFFRGVSGHLTKETARLGFKSTGLYMKPYLESYFLNEPSGKLKSDLAFAGGLSLAEILINPADTLRTMWQAGKKLSDVDKGKKITHLYKGAGANGLRQFGTWYVYTRYNDDWAQYMRDNTRFDPRSIEGIVAGAFPQSVHFTAIVWSVERLKNELQYHPRIQKEKRPRYLSAFQHIKATQGMIGLWRGFVPKVLGNTFLVIGSNVVLEQGRRAKEKL